MLSMMVVSSAEPDETTGGIIFTVLAVSLRPVFSLSDTSIQMNPRRLWGVGDSGLRILGGALGANRLIGVVFPAIAGVEDWLATR